MLQIARLFFLSLVLRSLTADEATTRHNYDSYGDLTQTTDPRNHVTKYTYGTISGCPESGANLYPTRVVEAFGSTVARTTAFAYNCASGRVTSQRDVDNSLSQTLTLGDAIASDVSVPCNYPMRN